MYIELTDGEIVLNPFKVSDKKQWLRVRALNRDWLAPWDSTVPQSSDAGGKIPATFRKMIKNQRREARAGRAYTFAIRKGPNLIGQITLGGVVYGALRGAHIGYWIDREYSNRGYITSAVNMVTDFAFNELELHRIEINIRPENQPSIRVAEKCGYLFEGERPRFLHIDGAWRDHRCYVKENLAIK